MCGEKRKTGAVPAPLPGSPPRMRGKARSHAQLYYDAGKSCTSFQLMFFIWDHPAYAGKRPVLFSDSWIHRDHPRVCGEKFKPFCLRQLCQGSPPRVRGKVFGAVPFGSGSGITPAYAGKRLKRSHSIGHFSCILGLFHSVLHRASVSGGSRAGPCAPPCLPAKNAVPV